MKRCVLRNGGKEQTYKMGYFRLSEGLFVNQLPINLVPLFFKGVYILDDRGYNMAAMEPAW